jgi:hypothetical protein
MAKKKKSLLERALGSVTSAIFPAKGIYDVVRAVSDAKKSTPAAAYISHGPAPSSMDPLLAAGQGVGTPLTYGVDYGPGVTVGGAAAPAGPDPIDTWLEQALAALGGGPDRNAYLAPFDAATSRANEAHSAALPVIAQQYDALRQQLGANQQGYQGQVAATQAAQQQGMQANQSLLQNLQAPVLADLQRQGGQAAVGSLTGALQAQMAAGQAGVQGAGMAQQQLSQNLANAGNQSFNSRLEDSRLAETAASGNASANLNSILNQIGLQRAGAEQQYNSAAQQFAQARSGLQLKALEAKQAQAQGQDDPLRMLQLQKAMLENTKLEQELNGPDTSAADALQAWHLDISERSPVAYDYLTQVMGESESLAQALARINRDAKGGTKIRYGGKSLDAATLRQWATEATRLEAAASSKK